MTPKAKNLPQHYNIKPMGHLPEERRVEIANEILMRYLQGEEIKAMAKDYGVSYFVLYSLLFAMAEDSWRDAQISRAVARHADALSEFDGIKRKLNAANDVLEIARQRELTKLAEVKLKSAQWEMERLLRRLYGDAVPAAGSGVIQINIGIQREPKTYEGEANAQ